jgi:hypothetical protein
MGLLLFLLTICSLIIGSSAAYYGPKRNLYISGICAIIFGFSVAFIQGININTFIMGIFISMFFGFVLITSGISVRKGKERGKAIFKEYFKKRDE